MVWGRGVLGWVVITSFEHSGSMKTNVEEVFKVINKARRSTVSKIVRRLGISYGINQGVLKYAMDLHEIVFVFSTASRTTSIFENCSVVVASNITQLICPLVISLSPIRTL
jgi:hypothetical protein